MNGHVSLAPFLRIPGLPHPGKTDQTDHVRTSGKLRSRLPKRILATSTERQRLGNLGRELGTTLRELMPLARYGTFR